MGRRLRYDNGGLRLHQSLEPRSQRVRRRSPRGVGGGRHEARRDVGLQARRPEWNLGLRQQLRGRPWRRLVLRRGTRHVGRLGVGGRRLQGGRGVRGRLLPVGGLPPQDPRTSAEARLSRCALRRSVSPAPALPFRPQPAARLGHRGVAVRPAPPAVVSALAGGMWQTLVFRRSRMRVASGHLPGLRFAQHAGSAVGTRALSMRSGLAGTRSQRSEAT
mmetsp:Transcript_54640/g.151278  ORF Transcript_54640/g.151278 Transcript_54640/m.151278 type:complete len:218 (+) Transcript_54640:172-825(+)